MKVRIFALIGLIVFGLFLTAGCSGDDGVDGVDPGQPADVLDGTTWELFAYRKSRPVDGVTITATFGDGRVGRSAGCNHYGAAYQIEGGRITVGEIEITEMACLSPEGVMQDEQVFIEYLGDAQSYTLEGERLYIYQSTGEALTFEAVD